jgi:hypothetical protein
MAHSGKVQALCREAAARRSSLERAHRAGKQLAEQFPTDIEGYIAGKTDFLLEILRSAGFPDVALLAIRDANRRN